MRVLIAEDEVEIARALKVLLGKQKIGADIVHNGNDAWAFARQVSYDVIVLDIMMPGINGLEVLQRIRRQKMTVPVMLLTARSEIDDRVLGLDMGADDYLAKPFASNEFIARIKALARRSQSYTEEIITIGNLRLDCNRFELSVENQVIRLNNKEFQLMELFMNHPRFVFSAEHLLEKVWGQDNQSGLEVVWTYIGFLRKKLKQLHASAEIQTVRGAGYALEERSC